MGSLVIQSLIYRFVQNGSFNGGSDATLEGTLNSGVNVAFDEKVTKRM